MAPRWAGWKWRWTLREERWLLYKSFNSYLGIVITSWLAEEQFRFHLLPLPPSTHPCPAQELMERSWWCVQDKHFKNGRLHFCFPGGLRQQNSDWRWFYRNLLASLFLGKFLKTWLPHLMGGSNGKWKAPLAFHQNAWDWNYQVVSGPRVVLRGNPNFLFLAYYYFPHSVCFDGHSFFWWALNHTFFLSFALMTLASHEEISSL